MKKSAKGQIDVGFGACGGCGLTAGKLADSEEFQVKLSA
jgi:hypothetical protein